MNFTRFTYLMIAFMMVATISELKSQTATTFTPSGKPVFLVFSNVHSTFTGSENNTAFELARVYLGYEYNFSKNLSTRVNLDMGNPKAGDFQMSTYIKNAFIQYKAEKFSGRFGMISTDAFNLIEKHWGYRYVFKNFQDEYGYNPSADLGAAIELTPSKFISIDASVLNGEGYKKIQADSVVKYTTGITLKPNEKLSFRVYTDFMKKEFTQNTISFYGGYTSEQFRLGAEYALQMSNKMIDAHDLSGFSVWLSVKLNPKSTAFARYDNLWSTTLPGDQKPWNNSKNGQLALIGVDYSPVKGVKIAPVYSSWIPADNSKKVTSTVGFYLEIKL